MSEWSRAILSDLLHPVDERVAGQEIELVLSVTEKRGIIPQTEVFSKRVATADVTKYKVLRPLDIAYNPYLLWAGAIGQWLGGEPGVTSPVYECFRTRPPHDPRFVGLLFESGLLAPYFDSTAVGSIQRRRRTTPAVFLAAGVTVPDLGTQRWIVDLVSTLDAHTETLQAEVARLSDLYAAWLSSLASRFALKPIEHVVLRATAGGTPSRERSEYFGGSIPWLKSGEVEHDAIDTSAECITDAGLANSAAKWVMPGSTLVAMYGQGDTKGRAGFVVAPLTTNQAVLALTPNPELVHDRYLLHAVRSRTASLRARAVGAAQPNLSKALVISEEVPLPDDLAVQQQEAHILDSILAVSRRSRIEHESLRALRNALLAALLSQKVEIRDDFDTLLEQVG